MAPDSPDREPGLQRASAAEQNPRLARDLREHRRADMAFAACATDELSELGNGRAMVGDPLLDAAIDVAAPAAAEEFNSQLLEVAREPGGEQPLPLVGGDEAGDLLLRPIEPQRLAEAGVGAGCLELIELLPRRQRGDSEHAVELVEAYQEADDIVACAQRDQPVAACGGFILDLGADELGSGRGNLAHARLEQRAELVDAGLAAAGTKHVGQVRADARRGNREQLNAYGLGQGVVLDLRPQLVEVEQSLGDEE